MSNHEFSTAENQVISELALWMLIVGGLALTSGILFVILGLVHVVGTSFALASILETLRGAVVVLFGLALVLPTDNLRRISKTEGGDINELMTGLREMKTYLTWALGLGAVMIPLVLLDGLLNR